MDADARKTALRMIPYELSVLTAATEESVGCGTINGVSQMSLEPPLLAPGVKGDTKSLVNLKAGGTMALSFMGAGQGDLAFAFFRDTDLDGDVFVTTDARIPVERTPGGAVVLLAAPVWAELTFRGTVEIGDHAVVVVEVTDVGLRQEGPEPLTLKELGLNYGG